MTQQTALLTRSQISAPFPADAGSVVTLTPSGGSAYLQYTLSDAIAIQNNQAVWSTWPNGTVTAASSAVAAYPMFVRAWCLTGNATLVVNDPDLEVFLQNALIPWKSLAPAYAVDGSGGAIGMAAAFATTWANRPLTGNTAGQVGWFTGLGNTGGFARWSGSAWVPTHPITFTARPNAQVRGSITTADTQYGVQTIPGGIVQLTSMIEVTWLVALTGNDSKNLNTKIGVTGTNTYATATGSISTAGLTTQLSSFLRGVLFADGSLTTLRSPPVMGLSNNAATTATVAINTQNDWDFYFGAQMSVAGAPENQATLNSYAITIHP